MAFQSHGSRIRTTLLSVSDIWTAKAKNPYTAEDNALTHYDECKNLGKKAVD